MKTPVLKQVQGDGVNITVAHWEGNKDKNVICIPGLAANSRSFDTILDNLSPRYNCFAVDLRGRGTSDRPDSGYGLDQHAEDIKCVLDNLNVDKVTIISHSFGGFVALVIASKYPEKVEKIINIDGGIQLPQEVITNITPFVTHTFERLGNVYKSFDEFVEGAQKTKMFQPWSSVVETMYKHDMTETPEGLTSKTKVEHIAQDAVLAKDYDYKSLYKNVKCPILAMRSTEPTLTDNDIVIPDFLAKQIVETFENAKDAPIKNTNHLSILIQENEERDRIISDFIEGA